MATELDNELVPMVLELVEELGKSVTFVVASNSGYDPTTGEQTSTTVEHTHKVTPPEPYRRGLIDGQVIQDGDCRIYLPASGLTWTPTANNLTVTIDSLVWQVVSAMPHYSGELVAVWEIQLRR